jgi:hypothetical protein
MWIDPQDAGTEAALTAQDIALTGLDLITGAVMATPRRGTVDRRGAGGRSRPGRLFPIPSPTGPALAEDPPARPVGVIRIRCRASAHSTVAARVNPLPSGARTS